MNSTPADRLRPHARACAALLVVFCLLGAPVAALASKGQKNFKQGLEAEQAQQWEKAAEEFALAVAADPSNAEYQLHYRRAVFNASQIFMQQGKTLSEQGDYVGAYNAFRRAYGYDQVNELARSLMERMLRLQLDKEGAGEPPAADPNAAFKLSRTSYETGAQPPASGRRQDENLTTATRPEQLRVITYSGDLEGFIKYLAKQLRLNVVFDRDFPKRTIDIDLQEVTAAQALDYIFLSEGLFFQKLSSRTILVADQSKRPQYQQLVLRTFYLSNIDPADAKALVQASIPPQAGRQPVITSNKATNSITVRDTPENVRLVGELLKGIDKDRAEVVMDVNIYEVSRTDLMQLGNQIGNETSLRNLGGVQKGLSIFGGSRSVVTQGVGAVTAPTALGAALIIPATTLSALQRKDNTRLIASTQVHAFDGERSTAHIGQRVPVQTASVTPFGGTSGEANNAQQGVATGLFGGNGFPVIQYEKTGLTLEFTPQVFPNLDVQVKMSIKSNDVSQTGGTTLTPTFTERNIEGTARIQNNRTMMIASVAQNQQSRGREGLPVLGLVPVLGRFFTAPRRSDHQTDIVIAVTPHVLRAPSYTPGDEESHPTGTMQTPNSDSLEAMLQETRREEQLAAARLIPNRTEVLIPDAPTETPTYVPAPKALLESVDAITANSDAASATKQQPAVNATYQPSSLKPASNSEQEAALDPLATYSPVQPAGRTESLAYLSAMPRSAAELRVAQEAQPMRVGEKRRLRVVLKTDAPLGLVAAALRFDPRLVAVRSVAAGNLFAHVPWQPVITQSVSPAGILLFSVSPSASEGSSSVTGAGVLLVVEVEALAEGSSTLSLNTEDVHLIARDGRKVFLKTLPGQLTVAP
ncbi:MAG TPA: secretin N-terminal domain-containing protein [Pyrinomonadaceae bacterium]|nr:secretin N-terminal domain-containing protein [Pyrinomonadaceae bacterium]